VLTRPINTGGGWGSTHGQQQRQLLHFTCPYSILLHTHTHTHTHTHKSLHTVTKAHTQEQIKADKQIKPLYMTANFTPKCADTFTHAHTHTHTHTITQQNHQHPEKKKTKKNTTTKSQTYAFTPHPPSHQHIPTSKFRAPPHTYACAYRHTHYIHET